ncbi:hypothetical protein ABG067_003205 [Albugo candida]
MKALANLQRDIIPSRPPIALRPLLSSFCNFYILEFHASGGGADNAARSLATTQLRETWNSVLLALVEKMKPKAFSPHISRLLPAWFLAMHDVSNQVGRIATLAFEILFPTWQQRREIVESELYGLLETFKVYVKPLDAKKRPIMQEKRGKKEGKRNTSTEDIQNYEDENYERCISAALRAMNTTLKYLTTNSDDNSESQNSELRVASLLELTSTPQFARLAVDRSGSTANDSNKSVSYQPTIRLAIWKLMRTIISSEILCSYLQSSQSRLEHYAKLILGHAVIERAIDNQSDAWELVLELLQRFSEIFEVDSIAQYFDVAVRPRILAQIRVGFQGAPAIFRMLLPFVSLLPTKVLAKTQKNSQFIVDILQQFWQFLCKTGREQDKQVALSCYFELLTASLSIFVTNDREELVLSFREGSSEHDLTLAADTYVEQFKSVMLALFTSAYVIPTCGEVVACKFSDKIAIQYGKELVSLFKTVSRSSQPIAQRVSRSFIQSFQYWISAVLLSAVSFEQLEHIATRWMLILQLDQEDSQDPKARVLTIDCIEKLTARCIAALMPEKQLPDIGRLSALLQLLLGLNKAYGVDVLLSHISVDEVYPNLYRPLFQHLAPLKYAYPDSEQLEEAFFTALKLVHYLIPKMTGHISTFLAQLFQDAIVQDCLSCVNVLHHSLQFPLALPLVEEWLYISASTSMVNEIWQSEKIDKFVLHNLEIEDPAFDSLDALLGAALGEKEACPLVSCATVERICLFLMEKQHLLCQKVWPSIVSFFTKLHRLCTNVKELERTEMSFVIHVFFDFTFESNEYLILKELFTVWKSSLQTKFVNGIATALLAYLEGDEEAIPNMSVWTTVTARYLEMTQWEAKDGELLLLHNRIDAIGGLPPKGSIPPFLTCFGALVAESTTARAIIGNFLTSQSYKSILELLVIDIFHRILWIRMHFDQILCDHDEMVSFATNVFRFIAESLVLSPLYSEIADSDFLDAAWNTIIRNPNTLTPVLQQWKGVLTLDDKDSKTLDEVAFTSTEIDELCSLTTAVVTCLLAPHRVTSAAQMHLDDPTTDENELERFLQAACLHNSTLSLTKIDRPLPITILSALKNLQCDVSTEMIASLKTDAASSVQKWHERVDFVLAALQSEPTDSPISKECVVVSQNLIRQLFSSADSSVGSMQAHRDTTLWLLQDECSETYPLELLHCRNKALELFSAALAAQNTNDSLAYVYEFASHHREALFLMLLYTVRDGIYLPRYMRSCRWKSSSYGRIKACLIMAESFACKPVTQHVLSALFQCLDGQDQANRLLMRVFGDVDAIMQAFSPEISLDLLTIRLAYVLLVSCQTLQLQDPTSECNQDDDQTAEKIALAIEIIPSSLQGTLEHIMTMKGTHLAQKLFACDLFLQLFPTMLHEPAISIESSRITSALTTFAIQKNFLDTLLTDCADCLMQVSRSNLLMIDSRPLMERYMGRPEMPTASAITAQIGTQVMFQTALMLPCMLRAWWNDTCSRSLRSWVTKYFNEHVTLALVRHELEAMERLKDQGVWDPDEITVKGSRVSRRITATYVKDDCVLEMILQIPACYPLYSVDVACGKRIGISEDRWRRGILHIVQTCAQNGALMDAVMLWKRNVDQEFQGVVPCPICYWILYPKTMAFPNLTCKTCKTTYHKACLYKWFMQSGKSVCTICQQPL